MEWMIEKYIETQIQNNFTGALGQQTDPDKSVGSLIQNCLLIPYSYSMPGTVER